MPDLDVYEGPTDFMLVLSVPGVGAEDLEVAVAQRTISISGRRVPRLPPGALSHVLESPRGRFQRRLRLPANADLTRLRLELVEGQLFLTIPKVVPPVRAIAIDIR